MKRVWEKSGLRQFNWKRLLGKHLKVGSYECPTVCAMWIEPVTGYSNFFCRFQSGRLIFCRSYGTIRDVRPYFVETLHGSHGINFKKSVTKAGLVTFTITWFFWSNFYYFKRTVKNNLSFGLAHSITLENRTVTAHVREAIGVFCRNTNKSNFVRGSTFHEDSSMRILRSGCSH